MSRAQSNIPKKLNSDELQKNISPKIKSMINQVLKEDHELITALKYL